MCFARILKFRPSAAFLLRIAVCALSAMLTGTQSKAFTPDDPQIVQMVDRGIKFLEGLDGQKFNRVGSMTVCAYTHFKVEHDESNPLVVAGIKESQEIARGINTQGQEHKSNYEATVATMLLCEISADRFRDELAIFKRYFDEIQMSHGGYGYPGEKDGDVSQTQYVILALWTLDRHGFKMDYNRLVKTLQWLLVVQDRNGPWPYHGKVPTQGGLTAQSKTSLTMALAGGGSLLIGGDALRLWGQTVDDTQTGIVGLPKAVKLYKEDGNAERRKTVKMSKAPVLQSVEFMNRWRTQNPHTAKTPLYWYFYRIYTLERFESFYEIANGTPPDKSPAWYNQIVSELMKMQSAESGGWEVQAHTSPELSTAFALLFLIRSTQKALGTGASASAIGGYQFGDDVSNAELVGGQVITKAPAQSVTQMLELLESDGADDLDGKALADRAVLPTNPVERSAQLDRLERLVRGSRSWQARRVSARLLGTSDDLRVVPALIYALSDPDHAVRAYARDGLRFISRKFEGFGMPDEPTNAEIRQAQRKWRQWYLTMKPGYVFIDEI